jgi:N-succinyldiaminopimelate aminotransferase
MNLGLLELKPYPFEQLAAIRARVAPPAGLPLINLSIGEPQHPTPPRVHQALIAHLDGTARYPATRGIVELRQAIVAWANRRFHLAEGLLDAERHVLPVNGTREALFAIAQCVVAAASERNLVVMPNPFYQIYEGAALLAGGTPYFLHCPPNSISDPTGTRYRTASGSAPRLSTCARPATRPAPSSLATTTHA